MNAKWMILTAILFFVPLPTHAQTIKTASRDPTSEFRALYENGYSAVMNAVPIDSTDRKYKRLLDLKKIKEKFVRWAGIGEKGYYALESGPSAGAWIAIIPPDHVLAQKQEFTLLIDAAPNMTVLRIKPDKITEIWAGIFLIHELSHLADRITKFESLNPTREEFLLGEGRAYELESQASNLVSRGAFEHRLDTTLAAWKFSTVKALVDKLMTLEHADVVALDNVVTREEPKSEAEASLRLGFYSIALFSRFLSKTKFDKDARLRGLNCLLMRAAWADDPYKKN
jgi:hypothetical protein